jgi:hypothetical protein
MAFVKFLFVKNFKIRTINVANFVHNKAPLSLRMVLVFERPSLGVDLKTYFTNLMIVILVVGGGGRGGL